MKLKEIYKHKKENEIVIVSSYATHIEDLCNVIVILEVLKIDDKILIHEPFYKYGSKEEIENEYELLISQEDFCKFESWDKVFEFIKANLLGSLLAKYHSDTSSI